MLRLAITGLMPRARSARRYLSWSYPRSASSTFGRLRGRPTLPATGFTPSNRGSSWVTSLRFPPVSVSANGTPRASVSRWCFEPVRARSTGEGPVRSPPKAHEYDSNPPRPLTSRSPRRRSVSGERPGASAPIPRPAAIPATFASTSRPSHSRTRPAGHATRSLCAARTRSRSARLDHPVACAPDTDTAARSQATTAGPQPTTRHQSRTWKAPPRPPIIDDTADRFEINQPQPLSETSSKSR